MITLVHDSPTLSRSRVSISPLSRNHFLPLPSRNSPYSTGSRSRAPTSGTRVLCAAPHSRTSLGPTGIRLPEATSVSRVGCPTPRTSTSTHPTIATLPRARTSTSRFSHYTPRSRRGCQHNKSRSHPTDSRSGVTISTFQHYYCFSPRPCTSRRPTDTLSRATI